MTDYVTWQGRIETLEWGKSTYTILRLPPDVAATLGEARRVEGEIAEHPVNLAVTRAPVIEDPFLWTGRSLLDRTGLAPGMDVEVRLRPADPGEVETPPDVTRALRSAGVAEVWEALTPGRRRGLLYRIETAKRDATRAARITAMIADLRGTRE